MTHDISSQEHALSHAETTKPELPLHVDSTMLTCAKGCLQKFKNEFLLGLRLPGISVDLHAGACFATALETVYRCYWGENMSLEESLDRARAAFFVEWGDFEIPTTKRTAKTPDRMWAAVEYYFAHWPPATDIVTPVMGQDLKPKVEYTFAIPLEPCASTLTPGRDRYSSYEPEAHRDTFPLHPSGSPFVYCGRFDMLAQTPEGRVMPKDDKTTGASIGQNWVQQWRPRSQFMGYVWAMQQLGYDCDQVHVRGLAIQMTQFVPAEDSPTYSHFMIERWHETLRRELWRIRRAYDEGYFDYNLGDACTTYGMCAYLDACTSSTPESWLAKFEKRLWNPLDKNPARHPEPALARAI